MFESAELGHEIDKERYEAEVPALRTALLGSDQTFPREGDRASRDRVPPESLRGLSHELA